MTESFLEALKQAGFAEYPYNSDLLEAFGERFYFYDTGMTVEGAHGSESAEILWADKAEFSGLCYAPTLLESVMLEFADHGVLHILKEIEKYTYISLELIFIGGLPMVGLRLSEDDFAYDARGSLGDMMKVVGMLELLLVKRLAYLRKKGTKRTPFDKFPVA